MESFLQALRQLGFNTTIHGCRHLVEDGRHWIERVIWLCVLAAAATGVTISCLDLCKEYMSTPAVTSLQSTQYPAWNVPFPAVSICNINKISLKRAQEFAQELSLLSNNQYSSNVIMEMLHNIGHIYDLDESSTAHTATLMDVLSAYNASLPVILKRLAPSCDSLLVRCRWKGLARSCRELFQVVATTNGFCCIFNMLPEYDGAREDTIAEALQSTGYRSGLSVFIDPQTDDYFYPVVPAYGVQVMFFSPLDHPENSNGMIEYVAGRGTELFYTVDVFSQFSTSELGYFTPEERGCFYRTEKNLRYTSTNCLADCMRELVLETCHCLPYYMKHSFKFLEYLKEDALNAAVDGGSVSPCGLCLPPCSNTWYEVQSSYAKIEAHVNTLDGLEVHENMSALHIYYATLDTTLYKQDVIYTRTELVSNLGGICSLFSGFSFLSLVEIVYFLTIRLFYITQETKGTQRNEVSQRQHQVSAVDTQPTPYWHEIRGQSNHSLQWTTHKHHHGLHI